MQVVLQKELVFCLWLSLICKLLFMFSSVISLEIVMHCVTLQGIHMLSYKLHVWLLQTFVGLLVCTVPNFLFFQPN